MPITYRARSLLKGLPLRSNGRAAGAPLTVVLPGEGMPGTEDGPRPGFAWRGAGCCATAGHHRPGPRVPRRGRRGDHRADDRGGGGTCPAQSPSAAPRRRPTANRGAGDLDHSSRTGRCSATKPSGGTTAAVRGSHRRQTMPRRTWPIVGHRPVPRLPRSRRRQSGSRESVKSLHDWQ